MNEKKCKVLAAEIRLETLKVIHSRGFGHVGGSMDLADLMAVLYGEVMKFDPKNPRWEDRDWLVLSKGHAGPVAYATFGLMGYYPMEEAYTLNHPHTKFPSHTDRKLTPGVDLTTDSLGQGASTATGAALGNKIDGRDSHVFCVIGDGEADEGQVWEAFHFASAHKLDNIIYFIDNNGYQLDGPTADILDHGNIAKKAESFGLYTQEIDGHDVKAIYDAIQNAYAKKGVPSCIVLDTCKGKGATFAEPKHDHSSQPNEEQWAEALAAAEKAEREYAAEAAAYAQTPAAIVEQARAVRDEPVGSFSIYQLKRGNETLDYRFEPLDSIHRNGLSVKPENYELVYEAPMTEKDNLESIYTRFNVDRPADFTGHSLSVSDIVVLHQGGKDTAHYCDRAGFSEVPEFLQPAQKSREITERIQTPRGSFYLCGMTREKMEADGYGFHHASEDGKYLIMANGTQAYAVRADAPEKDNPLRTAEMTLEDDYGMIDGVINNGRRGEELEKAKEHAERTQPEKKPSIRERLAAAKQECAKQQPRPATEKKPPELGER